MDLVKIGFQINANGLKDANTEVDKLLDKVDNIGTKGKKASSDFESSQKKVKDSTQQVTKEVDKTSKALEKQKIVGDYLGKGLDKTTASIMANFQMLGAKTTDIDKMFTQLGKNKGTVELNKKVEKLQKEYEDISKASVKYLGGGVLSQIGYQEQDLKNLNDQYRKAEQQVKQHGQNIYKQYDDISKSSTKRLGGGILDRIGFQESDLIELNNQYRAVENSAKAHLSETEKIRKQYDDISKSATKNLGGGVLDRVSIKNTELEEMRKMYKEDERIADAREKAQEATLAKDKLINAERQKAITLEQAKAKYVSQGYGKTDSTRLARLEVSGADVTTLNNYKSAIEATTRATQALNPAVEKVTTSHSNFLDQVKGIAIYAALSAAIYGVMTAMTNLAVATVKMADEYTSIQNRMKLYITDAKELGKVNSQLAQFSMENNVGLRETATLFSRLAPSMQKLGANTAAITTVVDAFGKSMRIGGATAMEAASATIQFSQAMASGKLAGDEFRSISEASPRFLKAIAEGSGIAADKLKEMSAAGMLTTQVISKALLKEYPKLIEENKKLGVTMEQGANAIKTGFLVAIGEFNEGAGITKALGEAMLDLAQGMLTGAQNARQFGKDVNDWFSANAGTISTVVDAFKLLATVIASKYVASMLVAGAISLKTAYNMNIAALGATALQRAFGVATIASLRLGSALASLATPKNLFTLGLTVAGVATAYLLLRDNAAEASKKIVESSEYADMTANSFKQLNEEQQKNVRASLTKSMSDVNEKLDEQANTVNRVLLSYVQLRQMQGKMNNKQLDDVINKTTKGLMDYDTAYRKLLELGAPTNVVEEFKKQKDVYNETAKSAKTLETSANAAGAGVKLAGNEAQNASPAIRGLKNDMDGLGDASISAADKFKELVNAYIQGAADIRTSLKVSQQYGLEQSLSDRVIKEAGILADSNEKIKSQTSSINTMREAVAKLSAEDQKRFKKQIEQIDKLAKSNKDKIAGQYIAQLAPYAQQLQASQNERSSFDAAQRKKDKPPKQSEINSFPEQLNLAQEYVKLLNQGVDLDVAKIASTKEYVKWYGTNLDMAKSLVAIDKQRAEIEKQRQEQEQKREAKKQGYKTVIDDLEAMKNKSKFIAEGFLPSVAEKSASLGFTPDAAGIQYAQKATTFELEKQADAYRNSAIEKRNIFELTKSGQTVEEAQIDNLIYTNKHLLPEQITLLEQIKELQVVDRRADTLQKVVADSNTMLREASIYAAMQNNELGGVAVSYDMINKSEVQHLNSWKDIVQAVKDYNDYLVNQKANPLGDFSNIDFDVFGDFGNPFQSALDGLNLLLGGADALKEKYDQRYATLDQQMKDAAGNQEALDRIELTRETLKSKQIVDQSNLKQQQVQAALKGVKSLFKEDSKGYKIVSGLEKAYQASKIAFTLWEKKDVIAFNALKLQAYVTDTLGFTTGAYAKIVAQQALNVAQAQGAVASAAQAPPPVGFASAAAMIALLAGIGIAIGGSSGGSYVDTSNQGTGTVFGDSEAKSASIANSIDLLSENSDLMLPLTSAMLRSLRNIESNIGGLTNLLIRAGVGEDFNIAEGFQQNSTGKYLGMAGQLAGGVGGAIGGGLLGSFGAGLLGAGMGSALGIGLGLATGGIGLLLGASLGKLLGGLFGTKTTVKASGLYGKNQELGDILAKGFNLHEYVDVNTKKKTLGVTTSNKNSTKYSKADAELSNQFTLIFKGFYDTILSATDILGADMSIVQTNLENAVVSIGKINLKGLSGEEIQEKLEAVFGAAADSLAKQAFGGLEDFQTVGEGYYETLVKVASAVEEAAYYTDRLNVTAINYTGIINKQAEYLATEIIRQSYLTKVGISTIKGGMTDLVNAFDGSAEEITDFINTLEDLQEQLFMTGKSGDYLTSSMILGAGGLDSLASGLDAYFEMLSPAEQAAELTRRLTKEFAILGEELPADVKAFRNLLNDTNKIDITTEAGQKLYGQIIALAPEFNDLQDALDSANSEVNALVQSLRDLAEQARAARGETEQPRNLAYLRNEFNKASELALQGDTEAANRLISIGKDLMSMSKLYSVTGSDYAKDLAFIQGIATAVADLQESGLGTSISSDLRPSTGNTTTPVVETTNTTTDSELKGMREDLNAGLLAIAKFTQSIDARQDRWDYGDRLLVRIEQDGANDKIPVTTV